VRTEAESRRWHIHVDDDFIHAETADEARVEFIQALVEDGSLIEVSEEPEDAA
jgi:hypothetical protein